MSELQIRRDDYNVCRVHPEQDAGPLAEGEIEVAIDRFAYTANNVTYAVVGDMIGYWQFFPPAGGEVDAWGITPVWGFANVTQSNHPDVPVGDRLYGYFPPAATLRMLPGKVTDTHLIESSVHRRDLPAAYNSYSRVLSEPGYDGSMDDMRMLLWPLHITAFCIWDAAKVADWYGAEQILILSASSKTSIGLGFALAQDDQAPTTIGMTSSSSTQFVTELGLYDQVLDYDAIVDLDASCPTLVIDMSGNAERMKALVNHLGDQLKFCIKVGMTHWEQAQQDDGLDASRNEFFFAPGHIAKRNKDWGADGFARRTSQFMHASAVYCQRWLKVRELDGVEALAEIYPDICHGRMPAEEGVVVQMGSRA